MPKRLFECTQPAPHRGLGLAHALCGCPERAAAGNRQKDPDIAPIEVCIIHFCMAHVQKH